MKKLLIIAAALVTSASVYAQGTVNFANLVPAAGISAPVFDVGGVTGLGNTFRAQLYGGASGSAEAALTAQGTPASFLASGFFSAGPVSVSGVALGAPATVQVRAWDGAFATYEAALAANGKVGKSALLNIATTGGVGSPPSVPADLVGLQSFSLTQVPEPGTLALGVLGAAALFLRRRK